MYDDVLYDPKTYTMNLNDVGLNSLYAIGRGVSIEDRRDSRQTTMPRNSPTEYEHMKQLVREKLWNDQDGIYENRFWNGQFSKRLSPTITPASKWGNTHGETARQPPQELAL